ncbi:MAG: hypothetical protein J6Y37_01745 [Paludibacteraceae bacterium]|nr:hypothetical protein [Paludibacteraceae bacterium]
MTQEEAKYIPEGTKVVFTNGSIGTVEDHPVRSRFTGRLTSVSKYVRMPSGGAILLESCPEKFNLL